MHPHLSAQGHNRGGVGGGIGHTEKQVDRSWAERGRAHAGTPGKATVGLGHERRRLLVADQHVTNRTAREGVDQVDVLLARDTEHMSHAFGFETVHDQVGNGLARVAHRSEV